MAHLSSIRLRGFKTFARPTELILQPGVTVIIGPNGSGKSNVADAVLWVLGEQSPGNLRGRSMQDVIFSGPDGRRSSAVAEVGLTFDNECGSLPLDCSQVEVVRRVVRDGASEYRINGSSCRLLDVQDLMGGLGLGREMHSVISQGKVEALLNSTPEARRALVEEAAGLGRFKKRRERARGKLDRTRQNLMRVSDVEREVKNSLRPLRQQAAAAERFAQAMEEWALARSRVVLYELAHAFRCQAQVDESLSRLEARRTEVEENLHSLRRQRAQEEESFTAALRAREDLGALFHRVRSEAERLEARAVALRQRLARAEGELDRARRRKELAEAELQSLEERVRVADTVTADEERLRRVAEIGRGLRDRLDSIVPAYRKAAEEEEELKDSVFEMESARARALQDRDFLRRELEEKARLGREIDELIRAASAKVEELQREGEARHKQGALLEDRVTKAAESRQEALSRRDTARVQEQEALREEARLTELLTGLSSRRAVLDDLLRRRDGVSSGAQEVMGALEGVRLLAEVLTVRPGFERALAAALGPVVGAVVVPSGTDVGLALRGSGPREVIWEGSGPGIAEAEAPTSGGPPPGTCDLWDVVEGPSGVIRTLRALVGPTAVLLDGSGAIPSGRGEWDGWKVVTKTGELVTPGLHAARRTQAGAEALLRAKNELLAVAEEEKVLLAKRDEVRQDSRRAAEAAREAEALYKRLEDELREAERRLLTLKNEVDLHARRLEEARTQINELQERAARERNAVVQTEAELKRVEAAISGREDGLDRARETLRQAQTRLEALRQEVSWLEEKKSQATLLEVRLKERCRAHETERQRASSQRESAAADVARMTRRVAMAMHYMPVLAGLLGVVERLGEVVGGIAQQLATQVEEARSRSEAAARVIREWGGAEAELQRELDELTAECSRQRVERVRLEDRRMVLEDELAELRRKHMAPRGLTFEDVASESRETLEAALIRAEQRRDRIGPVNPLAEQECAEMEERARFLTEQRRDLEASIAQLQSVIAELDEHIDRSFNAIFESVRENFAATIATVFPGAKGTLVLTEGGAAKRAGGASSDGGEGPDSTESAQESDAAPGISLSVKFPNKAPRSMSLLSGGEKAMTAIAFLFALFLARPCPFYILDEVEASLDDVNIRRFLSLVRKYRDRTQFIIITHQRQTMEIADTLYGIALEADGTSRVLSRRLGQKTSLGDQRERFQHNRGVG